MTAVVFQKLVAIFIAVLIGWGVGRMRWLGDERQGADPARTLSNAAFYIFVPALLFRTTTRLDLGALPWAIIVAYFVPVMLLLFVVYAWERATNRGGRMPAAAPSVRAISSVFGNTVQVGIPLAAALFGETGLGIHITVVSLHSLTLLTVLTILVEMDLARARARHEPHASALATLKATLRNTIVHPVVLPVIAGLVLNAAGVPLPPVLDEVLEVLGTAVVPLCLVLIGMSLAYYGVRGSVRPAIVLSVLKLVVMPALVLVIAHWGFGLAGMPLAVIVVMASLPVGSNALVFSQRYETLEAEATTAIVISTVAFVATAPVWLAILAAIGAI